VSAFASDDRLLRVALREDRARARTPEMQQELDVALYDLGESNRFRMVAAEAPVGPYLLGIGMVERLLALEVQTANAAPVLSMHLSLSPLRGLMKDYAAICESYFDAVKRLGPAQIEVIDMGRRGVHDEGARVLIERLEGRIETDHETARRLFTVICALQARG
jgi:uncharacterized protein (UPF0262 family)